MEFIEGPVVGYVAEIPVKVGSFGRIDRSCSVLGMVGTPWLINSGAYYLTGVYGLTKVAMYCLWWLYTGPERKAISRKWGSDGRFRCRRTCAAT